MGEIVVSIVIGGCLVVSGVAMILILHSEEKKVEKERNNK